MEEKVFKFQVPDGYEIDEIKFKKKESKPLSLEGEDVDGVYIHNNSSIIDINVCPYNSQVDKNIFASRKEAESALAMAQISLLLKYEKRYGGGVKEKEFDGKP